MIFLGYLLVFCVGIQVGWTLCRRFISRSLDEIFENVKEHIDEATITLSIKQIGGMFYAYNKDDGGFLAQAEHLSELAIILKTRFPDKQFIVESSEDMHLEVA